MNYQVGAMMRKYPIAAFAALGLMSLPVLAAEDSGFYAGLGLGLSNVDTDTIAIPELEFDYKFDDGSTAWKIFGGWRMNKYVSFELAYFDTGTLDDETTLSLDEVPTPVSTDVLVKTELDISGWAPYVIGTWPIGMFELSGKLGYAFYDGDIDVRLTDSSGQELSRSKGSESDEDFAWGLGVGVTVLDSLNIKLEYEALEISDANADIWWLTGAWRF